MITISTTKILGGEFKDKVNWSEIRWPDHFLWRNVYTSDDWQKADHPFKPEAMPGSLFSNHILFIFEE